MTLVEFTVQDGDSTRYQVWVNPEHVRFVRPVAPVGVGLVELVMSEGGHAGVVGALEDVVDQLRFASGTHD